MIYYVQEEFNSPIFKGTLEECKQYRDRYASEAKVVSEAELYIEEDVWSTL